MELTDLRFHGSAEYFKFTMAGIGLFGMCFVLPFYLAMLHKFKLSTRNKHGVVDFNKESAGRTGNLLRQAPPRGGGRKNC
jgi:hypothetical protein